MTPLPHVPATAPAGLLRFSCGYCGTRLEVPESFAGVRGPCPACSKEIAAPEKTPEPSHGAHMLAKPPPLRELPPPLTPVREEPCVSPRPGAPVFVERPASAAGSSTEKPAPPSSNGSTPARRADPKTRTAGIRLFPERERGIFEGLADGSGRRIELQRPAPALRRSGWPRWLDVALVFVFTALLLVTVAALRFTVPREAATLPGLPPNLTELVERESAELEMRRKEAAELACASVGRYLGAGSEQAAASHLLPPPEGMAPPPFPPFTGPLPQALDIQASRRIPGTDRFLTVVGAKAESGPVFVVEQTENGPRLHAGAITQQCAGLFQKFIATPGEGEATLYTDVRPTLPDHERDYRAQRPDLAEFLFVDVRSAFPGKDLKEFIACFKPGSTAAKSFSRRAHDTGWRPAIVHVRWQRHREAGPWAELVSFIPGPWSGERILRAPAATASTEP
jgi:hypothetical protein